MGRTQEFINAFGEDLLRDNTEKALAEACAITGAKIRDYTVAPHYMQVGERGFHQWFIEFEQGPTDLKTFEKHLDKALQQANSNYAQKRSSDVAIKQLEIIQLPTGFFRRWLKLNGKLGGQSKVPKLANHRRFASELLTLLGRSNEG